MNKGVSMDSWYEHHDDEYTYEYDEANPEWPDFFGDWEPEEKDDDEPINIDYGQGYNRNHWWY